jgi:hypothetical protein
MGPTADEAAFSNYERILRRGGVIGRRLPPARLFGALA